jgi:hypothetical protein
VPPTWNLPTYSTGVSQSVSDGPVADVLPEGIFTSHQEQHTSRKDRTQQDLVQTGICNVLGTMAGEPKSSAILSNGTWSLFMISHNRHAKIKFALRCRRLVLMPKHLKTSELSHARSKLLLDTSKGVRDALERQVLEWGSECKDFPMLQLPRPDTDRTKFTPKGLLKWYCVHLHTGADHLYEIREPAAGQCLLYNHPGQHSGDKSAFLYGWTQKLVDNYIEDAYRLVNMPRPSDPDQRYPSDDLAVLDLFWRKYYQNSVSFVMCTEVEQLIRFYQYRKQLMLKLQRLDSASKNDRGRKILKLVRSALLVGLFDCINWVDVLVRNVVLHFLLRELSTDGDSFDITDAAECIDDPGAGLDLIATDIEDLLKSKDTDDVTL